MAHYDIFREQLAIKYPTNGHALWEPSPRSGHDRVEVGDVGFMREGKFYRLFNALLSADHPSHRRLGVPEYHEVLVPSLPDHIDTSILSRNHYCSAGITMETEPDFRASKWLPGSLVYLHQEARRRCAIHSSTRSTSGHPRAWRFWKVDG
ncbi:hypothetical protein BC826DRAFT_62290 [Russula brevipes]|nr:hypothetical protein BC826DRAFT_62290 [Russula brevipes]